MLILGLVGGLDRAYEDLHRFPEQGAHDAAAVLLHDDQVVAAIEEERLTRIKHCNKFPAEAARRCLELAGAELADIDVIATNSTEMGLLRLLAEQYLAHSEIRSFADPRAAISRGLGRALGAAPPPEKIEFVEHHLAHAASAYYQSGFEQSLVITLDGMGDGKSGSVFVGEGGRLDPVAALPLDLSLGAFYLSIIGFLGYEIFEEYKVMGLAPYGDPSTYRAIFERLVPLGPEGTYQVRWDTEGPAAWAVLPQRRRWEPVTREHQDVAAALQETLERVATHYVLHHQRQTGLRSLCLAGGVAHNCSWTGKLLSSGAFDRIFVQPAAGDSGGALGAALWARQQRTRLVPRRLRTVSLGSPLPSPEEIASTLGRWSALCTFERCADVSERAAELLCEGQVLGWAQGRSEFGPRALGNRSIVADPRPASNKDRINAMVKKREGYRPFAPAVLEEEATRIFDAGLGEADLSFMTFVVQVRPEWRERLGATTHVDGSARVQTVSREANAPFWKLIDAFRRRSGVPVLLNTSFNNNAEPIVDSVEDALVCYLTTALDALVLGDWLVRRRAPTAAVERSLLVGLPVHVRLRYERGHVSAEAQEDRYELVNHTHVRGVRRVSPAAFEVLRRADGATVVASLFSAAGLPAGQEPAVTAELRELWAERFITLRPA